MIENKNRTQRPLMYIIDPLINERDQPQEQKKILMKKKLKPSRLDEEYTLIDAEHVTNLQKGMVIILNLEDTDSYLQNEVILNENDLLTTKEIDMTLRETIRHDKEGKEKLQKDMILNTKERVGFDYQETRHNHVEAAQVKNEKQKISVFHDFGKRDHPSQDTGLESLEADPFNPMIGIDLFHLMHKEYPALPIGTTPFENLEGTVYEDVTDNYTLSEISDSLDSELDLVEKNDIEEFSSLPDRTEETVLKSTEDGRQEVKEDSSEPEERIESTLAAKEGGNFKTGSVKEDVIVLESLSRHEEAKERGLKEIDDVNEMEAEASSGVEEGDPVFQDFHQGEVAEIEALTEEAEEPDRQSIDVGSYNGVDASSEEEAVGEESVSRELQQEEVAESVPLSFIEVSEEIKLQRIEEVREEEGSREAKEKESVSPELQQEEVAESVPLSFIEVSEEIKLQRIEEVREEEGSREAEEKESVLAELLQEEVAEQEPLSFIEVSEEIKLQRIEEVREEEGSREAKEKESVLAELLQEEVAEQEPLVSSGENEVKEPEGEEGIGSKGISNKMESLKGKHRGSAVKQQYKAEKGKMDSTVEQLEEAEKDENGNQLIDKKKAHVKVPTEKLLLRTMREVRSNSFKNKTVPEKIEYLTALPKHVTRVFVEIKTNKRIFFGVICGYSREQDSLTIINRNTLKLHTLEVKEIQNIKIISL